MRTYREQCQDPRLDDEDSVQQEEDTLPQIRISDCRPYTIVPQGVTDPPIPYTNPYSIGTGPSTPCTKTRKNENHSITRKKELTPVEEVEEYLSMEAAKERAARNKK